MSEIPCREKTCVAPEMCEELGHCTSLSKEMELVWKGTSIDLSRMLEKTKRELAEAKDREVGVFGIDCLAGKLRTWDTICGYVSQLEQQLAEANRRLEEAAPWCECPIGRCTPKPGKRCMNSSSERYGKIQT
jgi:hypothetical protein